MLSVIQEHCNVFCKLHRNTVMFWLMCYRGIIGTWDALLRLHETHFGDEDSVMRTVILQSTTVTPGVKISTNTMQSFFDVTAALNVTGN